MTKYLTKKAKKQIKKIMFESYTPMTSWDIVRQSSSYYSRLNEVQNCYLNTRPEHENDLVKEIADYADKQVTKRLARDMGED